MELSFEITEKINNYLTSIKDWKIGDELPPYLKLDATFGSVKKYLESLNYNTMRLGFDTFYLISSKELVKMYQLINPLFNPNDNNNDNWYGFSEYENSLNNSFDVISVEFRKPNPLFDYDLCEIAEENNEDYLYPEELPLSLCLNYETNELYLYLIETDY